MAWEWIWSTLGSGAVAATLLAVAGYLGRSQLAHWLSRDLEKIKAQHARELEAYKVGLIAEAERAKASQEVKKSMAIRIAEKRFEALDKLHRSLAVQPSLVAATIKHCASTHRVVKPEQQDTLTLGNAEMGTAISLCTPFLNAEEMVALREISALCANYTARCFFGDTGSIDALQAECSRELFSAARKADAIVFGHLKELLDMT